MNRAYPILCFLLFAALRSPGQTYFNERYPIGSNRYSAAVAVAPADSDSFVMAGQAEVAVNGDLGILLQRITTSGQVLWSRLYHRPGRRLYPSYSGGLTRTHDGGYAMAGSDSFGPAGRLWRFNAHGDTLWTRAYVHPAGPGLGIIPYSCR